MMATGRSGRWGVLVLSLVVIAAAWLQPLDRLGTAAGEQAFQRALAAFAVARTLNGIISLAQGTELAVQPAGVGISFSAGEVLDPVNDLVERFSWLMLASSAVLGLQLLLAGIMASPGVTAVATVLLLIGNGLLWADRAAALRRALFSTAVVLVTLRFLFPMMALAQQSVHQLYLTDSYSRALGELEVTSSHIRELAEKPTPERNESGDPEHGSWWKRLNSSYDAMADALNVDARLQQLQAAAEALTERIIQLIVAFLLETMVIPLGILWAGVAITRTAVREAWDGWAPPRPQDPD